ncbi:MAG: c-type cytochrome [Deltaproteobacteria bacterium]|nr:c-type cytochrome [Deltaproteobacteria bacterium]
MTAQQKPGIDVDTGHDYDGIREYDNPLPMWWFTTFVVCIAFGYAYWMHYEVARTGPSLMAEYQADQAEAARRAAASKPLTDELLVALSKDPQTVETGAKLFSQSCAVCHGAGGEGKIGPNLTDAYWLHGPKPTDIHKVIAGGVVEKGMPAWNPVLGPERVRALAAYVLTRRGLELPGKGPQGERYVAVQ